MRTVLIDNHDSFTANLAQLIGEVTGEYPVVVANDAMPFSELPLDRVDAIVLSPGPGRPDRPTDVGLTAAAVRSATIPMFGVCLGHQSLAHEHGGRVTHAPVPVHGGVDAVHHTGAGLFAGLPSPFRAVRYHSLHVAEVPAAFEVVARSRDGVVMGIRHRQLPRWGVQFHPESICSEHGARLVANLRDEALAWWRQQGARQRPRVQRPAPVRAVTPPPPGAERSFRGPMSSPGSAAGRSLRGPVSSPGFELHAVPIAYGVDAAATYDALFAASPAAFWLDSATAAVGRGQWSFLGDASGPHAEAISYDLERGIVTVEAAGAVITHHVDILTYLEQEMERRRIDVLPDDDGSFPPLIGGYVGYLGYEVKRDAGATTHHPASTPDAGFVFADRLLAVDHRRDVVWAVALSRQDTRAAAQSWIAEVTDQLQQVTADDAGREEPARAPEPVDLPVRWRHGSDRYLQLIEACQQLIVDGESYELCLTDSATVAVDVDPVVTYHELRRINPAPHGALLRFAGLSVLSSSPERFLHIAADGTVEARPIKGTRARAEDPLCDAALADDLALSDKDRAENLMIVDLLRNDLGSVCAVGSVTVPELFGVESYATVHQLVSSVRGQLRDDVSAVGCVRAAFPGGSMTGAPKRRSMEILDRLEEGPRGVYSGALGYLSLSGEVDLSIVIRSLVVEPGRVTLGAGGAIVARSDPWSEVEEVATKAGPLLAALARVVEADSRPREDDPVPAEPTTVPGRPTADRPAVPTPS